MADGLPELSAFLLLDPLTLPFQPGHFSQLLTGREMGEEAGPYRGSRITCRSVTPRHPGEQKADPEPTAPTGGNKAKLRTPGQSQTESSQGLTQSTVGTAGQDLVILCQSASGSCRFHACIPSPLLALPRAPPGHTTVALGPHTPATRLGRHKPLLSRGVGVGGFLPLQHWPRRADLVLSQAAPRPVRK